MNSNRGPQGRGDNDRNSRGNNFGNKNQGSNGRDGLDLKRKHKELERLENPQGVKDKVFIGGLDYNLSDEEFRKHFEQYGPVKDAQIVRDPTTGKSKGFGFVTYYKDQIVKKLITEIQCTVINGRKVDMRTAEPKLSDKITTTNKSVHQNEEGGQHANHHASQPQQQRSMRMPDP